MLLFATLLSSALIGFLVGVTGIGGILLPPVMVEVLHLSIHDAMGTSLASFVLPTVLASYLHQRRGNIDWQAAWPLAGAGLLCVLIGTWLKSIMSGASLNLVLSVLIIVAGLMVFRPLRRGEHHENIHVRRLQLAVAGGFIGIISGITGAGGPVLSVPVMIVMGYAPLTAIAVGQVFSVGVSAMGTVGNTLHHSVNFPLALYSSLGQLVGIWLGIVLAHRLNTQLLKRLVAGLCVLTGVIILIRVFI